MRWIDPAAGLVQNNDWHGTVWSAPEGIIVIILCHSFFEQDPGETCPLTTMTMLSKQPLGRM